MTLEEVRKQIDMVDKQIKSLFKERMMLADQVARVKTESEDAIYKPDREEAIITKLTGDVDDSIKKEYTALIKPILHVDDEGHLINVSKVRGRKSAITELVNRMEKLAVHPEDQDIFISHGDCIEDAEKLASIIKERFGNDRITISYVGPVIGAHSGPGTLALFFLGEHR